MSQRDSQPIDVGGTIQRIIGAMRHSILHLADLHLGAALQPDLEECYRSQLAAARHQLFDRLATWIARQDCPVGLVLIAGDLFDEYAPELNLAAGVRAALGKIAQVVPVITVPGNHDELSYAQCVYRQPGWPGTLVQNPVPEVVWQGELAGRRCAVVSAAYQAGKVPPGQKLALPPREKIFPTNADDVLFIGLFHATVADHFPPQVSANERCFWISHQEAAELGYDYLALGHIHTRREWSARRCLAHYPGPPVGPRLSDPGSGCLSLVKCGHGHVRIEPFKGDNLLGCAWEILKIEVKPDEAAEQLGRRISGQIGDGFSTSSLTRIYGVRLTGRTLRSDLVDQVEAFIREKAIPCVITEERLEKLEPPNIEALAAEESLVGYFVRHWQKWKQTNNVAPEEGVAVLYEGLLALGWRRTEGQAKP
ncbi:DNA repair exonuclease [Thermogutta sp.]|uniref:metallophosphoesterase family protein n=1 Tax=Thermogutta sp. TaxID=1962930 RepID=UPI003220A07B